LTPKVQSFSCHYSTVILPTKPYMPRHKGKVESSVKYVQANALKGRKFPSNEVQNRFLADWEAGVADTRILWAASSAVKACHRNSFAPRAARFSASWVVATRWPRTPDTQVRGCSLLGFSQIIAGNGWRVFDTNESRRSVSRVHRKRTSISDKGNEKHRNRQEYQGVRFGHRLRGGGSN
jgi:hypothetical protein